MSRSPPGQPFGYVAHPVVAPNYYYDDTEDFVGDYSENEGISDGARLLPPPNVTEIYRRKPAMGPPHEPYRQQNVYMPPNYYYEAFPPPIPQQMRRPAVPTAYRRHIPVVDERGHYYSPGSMEAYRGPVVYSSPQITTLRRPATHASLTPAAPSVVRRHPVTVRTPRYYRRNSSNLCKKPSALCLPIACQPDPAVYRRHKKIVEEIPFDCSLEDRPSHTKIIERSHSVPMAANAAMDVSSKLKTPPQPPIDYPSELHMTQSDVDAVLARYETILGDHRTVETTTHRGSPSSSKSSVNEKSSNTTHLQTCMKPKVPPSIKEKQERLQKCDTSKNTKPKSKNVLPNIEHLDVEEITTEVLDSMLSDLMDKGCENKINGKTKERPRQSSAHSKRSEQKERKSERSTKEDLQYPKSFNYEDITQSMKSQEDIYAQPATNSQICSPQESPRYDSPNNANRGNMMQNQTKTVNCHNCRTVEECSAMELHRSKSYIVSLIDRALSKELGTVPDERSPTSSPPPAPQVHHHTSPKECEQIDARQAIDIMNKNFDKMDKGLCLEITQALTDSIVSNATAPHQTELNHSSTCSCDVQEEPLYVKQLKQLRWGHLKHIQREVRRLEDLERFLDSCSSGSFS